jgi:hypothetical protein
MPASVLGQIQHWLHHHHALGWMAALAPVAFVVSLVAGVAVVVRLPPDYFLRGSGRRGFWHAHPAVRLLLSLAKNLVGLVTFLVGFVMALPLVPGPGVLFMLLGLGLVDFPGKRALERRLLRFPRVLASVNKLRARFGKPPLVTDDG